MQSVSLWALLLGAIGTVALNALPAQAQYVSIPITNGNFTLTNTAGNLQYSVLPTFLTPAGTISITSAGAFQAFFFSPSGAITQTSSPAAAQLGELAGSANLNDGRTASFTNAIAAVKGTATLTGAASWTVSPNFGTNSFFLPNDASVVFVVQSGALNIPANNLSSYPTTQFTIPISGGSFTITDDPGTGFATLNLTSILTPIGTASLTVTSPTLSTTDSGYAVYSNPGSNATVRLGGFANGTVALNDGRTATVTNQLLALTANTQLASGYPGGDYVFNARVLTETATIQGTITGGSISVPDAAVAVRPLPMQPSVLPPQPVTPEMPLSPTRPAPVTVTPQPTSQPEVEFTLAQQVNLGGEPIEFLKLVEDEVSPIAPPEVEVSSLEVSRIHPGLRAQ